MKQILFTSALAMLLFSCKKNDNQTPPANNPNVTYSIADYSKLTVGNYWVYEEMDVAPAPFADTTFIGTDSCYIKNDTIINGNTYAVIFGYPGGYGGRQFLRDSSTFLVDQHGVIRFTTTDFNTILAKDSVPGHSTTTFSVPSLQSTVVVPLGTYTCYDYIGKLPLSIFNVFIYYNTYYAPNIGVVEFTGPYSFDEANTLQYRLIRAHVM